MANEGLYYEAQQVADAAEKDLLNFIGRMRRQPRQVRLVHGDAGAKQALAAAIRQCHPAIEVSIP